MFHKYLWSLLRWIPRHSVYIQHNLYITSNVQGKYKLNVNDRFYQIDLQIWVLLVWLQKKARALIEQKAMDKAPGYET